MTRQYQACLFQHTAARRRLELQVLAFLTPHCFNTQPPEGGWDPHFFGFFFDFVSTHSRPKAAGFVLIGS